MTLFCLACAILVVALLAARVRSIDLSSLLLGAALAVLCVALYFLFRFLNLANRQHEQADTALNTAETSLLESERKFRQMADNIQEIFWMIDADTKKILYVNAAYETITGRGIGALQQNPLSYQEVVHPEDRARVLLKLDEATHTGRFDERFRIVMPTGESRWAWSRGFPVEDAKGQIRRLVGTTMDITTQKHTEEEVARNLALAESAWSEADALRKATLALTQDLHMDKVLDALLQSLRELVPYESAQIWLHESDSRLYVARQAPCGDAMKPATKYPLTLHAGELPLVQKILINQCGVLFADTKLEPGWKGIKGFGSHSWLGVPLVASHQTMGLLTLGHSRSHAFTQEHLRLAESLAIPAAAAIQNARLYECAEICGTELEKQSSDLQEAQSALRRFQRGRPS